MLTETNIQTLECLLDLYKNEHHKINFSDLSEEESVTALNYMLQLFDLNSSEFEELYLQSGLVRYCDLAAIKDLRQLRKAYNNKEEQKQLISKLINYSIDGACFKKYIYSAIVDLILRFRLLHNYTEFVEIALQIIKDKTIPDIALFLNTEVNE